MKWINAKERFPIPQEPTSLEQVTMRYIDGKNPVANIYAYCPLFIELDSGSSMIGSAVYYDEIEWLDEELDEEIDENAMLDLIYWLGIYELTPFSGKDGKTAWSSTTLEVADIEPADVLDLYLKPTENTIK